MVQRYRPDSDEEGRSFEMIPDDGGDYVAYEDYEELEDERDADRRREYGYSQETVDALTVERDKLEEENQRLRAFWEWSRLADKMTFEQYHWKEASHE